MVELTRCQCILLLRVATVPNVTNILQGRPSNYYHSLMGAPVRLAVAKILGW